MLNTNAILHQLGLNAQGLAVEWSKLFNSLNLELHKASPAKPADGIILTSQLSVISRAIAGFSNASTVATLGHFDKNTQIPAQPELLRDGKGALAMVTTPEKSLWIGTDDWVEAYRFLSPPAPAPILFAATGESLLDSGLVFTGDFDIAIKHTEDTAGQPWILLSPEEGLTAWATAGNHAINVGTNREYIAGQQWYDDYPNNDPTNCITGIRREGQRITFYRRNLTTGQEVKRWSNRPTVKELHLYLYKGTAGDAVLPQLEINASPVRYVDNWKSATPADWTLTSVGGGGTDAVIAALTSDRYAIGEDWNEALSILLLKQAALDEPNSPVEAIVLREQLATIKDTVHRVATNSTVAILEAAGMDTSHPANNALQRNSAGELIKTTDTPPVPWLSRSPWLDSYTAPDIPTPPQQVVTREELDIMIANGEDVTNLDVSGITDLRSLFRNNTTFNQDISGWDVSNCVDFSRMFQNADSFNQNISGWDMSSALSISKMFLRADSFNQDISGWATGNIKDMSSAFYLATAFGQDLSSWDVSSVTTAASHNNFGSGNASGFVEPNWSV